MEKSKKNYAIGVDIGGSHIGCALVDMEKGLLVPDSKVGIEVDSTQSSKSILESWSLALESTAKNISWDQIAGIGMAMPGPFKYDEGIAIDQRDIKFKNLYGLNLREELQQKLGLETGFPVRFINDATAFAVGEDWLGETKSSACNIAVTLGTGLGAAFIADGVPVVEGEGIPENGCLWHIPYKSGIADEFFSTRWFEATWKNLTGEKIKGAKSIAEKVPDNTQAAELFVKFGSNLGEFLTPWIKSFGADKLVLGGNITGAYSLFGPMLEAVLTSNKLSCKVSISVLKEDAAIIGSAKLIDEQFYSRVKPVLSKM